MHWPIYRYCFQMRYFGLCGCGQLWRLFSKLGSCLKIINFEVLLFSALISQSTVKKWHPLQWGIHGVTTLMKCITFQNWKFSADWHSPIFFRQEIQLSYAWLGFLATVNDKFMFTFIFPVQYWKYALMDIKGGHDCLSSIWSANFIDSPMKNIIPCLSKIWLFSYYSLKNVPVPSWRVFLSAEK